MIFKSEILTAWFLHVSAMPPAICPRHGESTPDPRRTHAGPNGSYRTDIELFNLSKMREINKNCVYNLNNKHIIHI